MGQRVGDQVYHKSPSLYSILGILTVGLHLLHTAISNLKSTLCMLTICVCVRGKMSYWRAFVISCWCICKFCGIHIILFH